MTPDPHTCLKNHHQVIFISLVSWLTGTTFRLYHSKNYDLKGNRVVLNRTSRCNFGSSPQAAGPGACNPHSVSGYQGTKVPISKRPMQWPKTGPQRARGSPQALLQHRTHSTLHGLKPNLLLPKPNLTLSGHLIT